MKRALGWLLVAVVAMATSCGLSEDAEPRIIAQSEIPEELLPGSTETTVIPDPEEAFRGTVFLWDTDTEHLASADRLLPLAPNADTLLRRLIEEGATPAEIDEQGLSSRVSPETVLLDVDQVGPVVRVNLSEAGFGGLEGTSLQVAVAQMVYTLTSLDGTEAVEFRIDDLPIPVPRPDGSQSEQAITQKDYIDFAPL